MIVSNTGFEDLKVLEPRVFNDARGCFFESYNKKVFEENGLYYNFNQDNQSESIYGTIRGLHYQIPPYAQAKLVRVLRGTIIDIAVDLRKDKATFGKYFSIELSDINRKQLLIPVGFAHGFSVIGKDAIVSYKVDMLYNPSAERSIRYNDPRLNIDWNLPDDKIILSEKDLLSDLFDPSKAYF
jgi:dTDP-4-dehydrorhamnose 3,5-epimerase